MRRRPLPEFVVGSTLHVHDQTLCIREIGHCTERREGVVEHVTQLFTRLVRGDIAPMPVGDASVVAEFFRYHVLVRVFDGDPDAWLESLLESGGDDGDVRFVRWIRTRLRQDPALIVSIRRMVDATPFWRAIQSRT